MKLRMSRHEDEVAQMTFLMNSRLGQELRRGVVGAETKLIQQLKTTVVEYQKQLAQCQSQEAAMKQQYSSLVERLEYDLQVKQAMIVTLRRAVDKSTKFSSN